MSLWDLIFGINSPTPYSEYSSHADEFDFLLRLTHQKDDIEQCCVLHRVGFRIEEHSGEVFGELIVVFELIPHRIQQRRRGSHVTYRSPGTWGRRLIFNSRKIHAFTVLFVCESRMRMLIFSIPQRNQNLREESISMLSWNGYCWLWG